MRVVVSVGSNIEPERNLPAALALLGRRCRIVGVSPVFRTAPVGAPGAPQFLNAALLLDSDLPPDELRERVLRPIEAELGRQRSENRNAPRTIDLDIVLYGEEIVRDATLGLVIPDPELARRPHLAAPVAAVAPDLVHPELGRTLSEIAGELGSPGPVTVVAGWLPISDRGGRPPAAT